MPTSTRDQQPTLLDEVRQVLRLHHSSMHTERSSVEWIVRFVRCHRMRSRQDLFLAAPKIASFLTDLAVHGHGAAATQNADMSPIFAPLILAPRVRRRREPPPSTRVWD